MTIKLTGTPQYVLLSGFEKLGPPLASPDSSLKLQVVYGFTNKGPYETFCSNAKQSLTPYPLVKEYLKRQIGDANDATLLIAVDALGPNQEEIVAVTMAAVLEAQTQHSSEIIVSHRLTLDGTIGQYRTSSV